MKIASLERDLSILEDFVRWVEYKSGKGDVRLTREQYDDEVDRGDWEQEDVAEDDE